MKNRNLQNGFTLVELAIVLVIIGLIMGIAIKGKSMIDVAQMMKEVNKVRKIQTAYDISAAKGRIAREGDFSTIDITSFFNDGTLTPEDMNLKYSLNLSWYPEFPQVTVLLCSIYKRGKTVAGDDKWEGCGGGVVDGMAIFPSTRFLCALEVTMDDGHMNRGSGLSGNGVEDNAETTLLQDTLSSKGDCYSLSGEAEYGKWLELNTYYWRLN